MGTWRKTGELQITVTSFAYLYDEMEELTGVSKDVSVIDINPDFNSFVGTTTASLFELYPASIDDLGFAGCEPPPPVEVGVYSISGRRVCVED